MATKAAKKKAASKPQGGEGTVLIEFPVAEVKSDESGLDMTHQIKANLGRKEREAFLRLRSGLRRKSAKLASGRPVWSSADVVRWICEQADLQMAQ